MKQENQVEIPIYRQVLTLKSEQDIEEHADFLNEIEWSIISGYSKKFSFDFLKNFSEQLDWEKISKEDHSIEFIREFKDKLNLQNVFLWFNHNSKIFDENLDLEEFLEIDSEILNLILRERYCSEAFIEKYQHRFDLHCWHYVLGQDVSEEFRQKYKNELEEAIMAFAEEKVDASFWDEIDGE